MAALMNSDFRHVRFSRTASASADAPNMTRFSVVFLRPEPSRRPPRPLVCVSICIIEKLLIILHKSKSVGEGFGFPPRGSEFYDDLDSDAPHFEAVLNFGLHRVSDFGFSPALASGDSLCGATSNRV